jgi:hypothetical protein
MEEKQKAERRKAEVGDIGPPSPPFAVAEAPTAAPGAKAGESDGHRLLLSGDCSCGWKAGGLLSYDQAVTGWKTHRVAWVLVPDPAPDAGNVAPAAFGTTSSGPVPSSGLGASTGAPGAKAGTSGPVSVMEAGRFVCGYCRRPHLTMAEGCDCDGWKAAAARGAVTYSEGKKIYDQGWNDGIEHLRKVLSDAIKNRNPSR